MQDFKRLRVWQQANALSVAVYSATRTFPREERAGLTAQLRRAVVSIQSNIAEACGRRTRADTARLLQIALGEANEVDSHLHLSRDLGFVTAEVGANLENEVNHVKAMLIRLLARVVLP